MLAGKYAGRGGKRPRRIVYLSCNPSTLARDARILSEGGYALTKVRPIDQFIWSGHIELIGVFDGH